ncbi:sensor histidine kinase [Cohnella sp. JJ-181]|uniref:sensor histidine kinase n=1 Tax=Cohnella rhizoplanae TaxID=2974897 RepID=UPI0022FF803D|nr:histidine kinase [Cohnella sp. JJ-181]CAI6039769.1 hypothetical protein COHCIP112018_01037 [Cohnella sp. JJ-181]
MFRRLGFQNKLILTIMIVFFLILLSSISYLYAYMRSTLVRTELAGLAPTTQKISDQVDTLYKQIDYAALGFTNNQDNLNVMVELSGSSPDNTLENYISQANLAHNLNAIYNVVSDLYRVIVFVPDKNIYFSYFRNEHLQRDIPSVYSDPASLSALFGRDKLFAALPPHADPWSTEPGDVISVVRKFSTPYFTDFGMVEIQLPYASIAEIAAIDREQTGKQVLIFDAEGSQIYPALAGADDRRAELTGAITDRLRTGTDPAEELRLDGRPTLVSTYKSAYLGWTTVVVDDGLSLSRNLARYRTLLFVVGLFTFLGVLIVYYLVLRLLTKPLRKLTRTVRSVSLDNLSFQQAYPERYEYDELILLNRSFENMVGKLKQSINTEYESRIREAEANYLALQAQINPHFLFNTLNVIAVHCEESDALIAADMCCRLAEMMRYSASSADADVPLADELQYSALFLDLMRLHYDDSLFYDMDVPAAMGSLRIPKLSLQPFVENAIDHGFDKRLPPWHIRISGRYGAPDDWELAIEDDGAGFEPAALAELESKLYEYRSNLTNGKLITNLRISGLGILNTFVRLVIHFGDEFYFQASNRGDGGSRICFGVGKPNHEEDRSS